MDQSKRKKKYFKSSSGKTSFKYNALKYFAEFRIYKYMSPQTPGIVVGSHEEVKLPKG